MATPPEFIERDPEQIVKDMIDRYEALVGRTLQPSQPERLLINTFAYRESILRSAIQEAALQNLVEFSRAPVLDYLADLVGVTRLAPSPATVTMEFSKVAGSGTVTVPAGTRIRTADGEIVFATIQDIEIPAGQNAGEVSAEATTNGEVGNGYLAGDIDNILDPMSFISEAVNVDESAGGADQETDEALRERIKIAPEAFSNAGSRGAYRFFAQTANPAIIDVSVLSPGNGIVEVYPLIAGGEETPQAILDSVDETLNADSVRPLSDLVNVIAPTRLEYTLSAELTIFEGEEEEEITAQVESTLEAMTQAKWSGLGMDITTSEVVQSVMSVAGVYAAEVTIDGPAGEVTNLQVSRTEFAFATQITVTIDGTVS